MLANRLFSAESVLPENREFPIQFREGLLWVLVQTAESPKPLTFLLDTGAEVSVINLDTAKEQLLYEVVNPHAYYTPPPRLLWLSE